MRCRFDPVDAIDRDSMVRDPVFIREVQQCQQCMLQMVAKSEPARELTKSDVCVAKLWGHKHAKLSFETHLFFVVHREISTERAFPSHM